MTLYHGAHSAVRTHSAHEGMCLTDDQQVAEAYAGERGQVWVTEVSLAGLVIEACKGYDHDTNSCSADREAFRAAAAARGVDILRYDDEDQMGREHACWRLVSARAVAAVALVAYDDDGCEEDEEG